MSGSHFQATSFAGGTLTDADLYHFGVLTSSVHMVWMRAVCGRLKSDYRYSKEIVYNNFIWPRLGTGYEVVGTSTHNPVPTTCERIASTAQAILDARALFAENSLADLYDPLTMPTELRKAHQANDEAVISAYGWKKDITETEIVAQLMQLYQKMVSGM